MTIRFSCSCGKHISAPDSRAGKPGKCPQCGEPIVVPMPGSERAETLAGVRALLGVRPAGDRSTDTAELPAEEPENQLGRYPVTGSLGKGGMGEVLLVEDPELGRDLAAKVIRGTGHADRRLLEKFLLEAKITGRLEHPNIVPVHELGTAPDGRVYFTMKRVRGKDLAAILGELRIADCGLRNEKKTTSGSKRRRRAAGRASGVHIPETSAAADEFSLPRLLDAFLKVCDAVAFAHSKGVIHRDLKPANVMVGEFGEVQVMDWGLAKISGQWSVASGQEQQKQQQERGADNDPLRTLDGSILGTPAYMPPEQAQGKVSELDERSDIYSLGAILYEILTLVPPYSGRDARLILADVIEGRLVAPSARAPGRDVPRELEAVVERATARDPARRYRSAKGLRADVEAFLAGKTLAAARYTTWQRAWKVVLRHKAVSAVSAAAALLLFFVTAGFVWRLDQKRREAEEARDEAERAGYAEEIARKRAEENEKLAVQKTEEATAARDRETTERNRADEQAGIARDQTKIAEDKAEEARLLLGDALEDKARLALERKRTSSALVLAQGAIGYRDTPALRTLLANALKTELWRSRRLSGHHGRVSELAFSPDGKRLATASSDNTVRLWDGEIGRAIATLEGHGSEVNSVAFSPDGKRLATASSDKTVRLWDADTGRAISTLEGHGNSVTSVAFSPDGKRLASGSEDNTVRLWDAGTVQTGYPGNRSDRELGLQVGLRVCQRAGGRAHAMEGDLCRDRENGIRRALEP